MQQRACRCEADRLRRHVEGRLGEEEQDQLAAHLEHCESCRGTLDALAGDDRLWSDLRVYLVGEPDLSTPPPGSAGPARDEGMARPGHRGWHARQAILAFLDPPADSRHMGSLGPYQIVEVIGRGGMGLVLKGSDPALGRVVAIKVLAPELSYLGTARQRFAREARAAASVAHDHVVPIHAVDSWKGLPYLVMQYVAGRSLQERIEREGPLAVAEVLRIGMQVASGLAAAHAQGLVHRDIKPANILLENGIERVKITDFGLARAADDASLSQSGVAAGTPNYMSPEQARCEPIDPRTDLFALGGVLYTMCTGHPPFRAETAMAVLRRVCEESPKSIRADHPAVPAWLETIIARLLAKDPAARFQSAAEVAEVLGRCLVYLEQPTLAPPFPTSPEGVLKCGREKRLRASTMIVLLLGAGFGTAEVGRLAATSGFLATFLPIRTEKAPGPSADARPGASVAIADDGREAAARPPAMVGGGHRAEESGGNATTPVPGEWRDAASRPAPLPSAARPRAAAPGNANAGTRPAIGSLLGELRPVPLTCREPVAPWPFGVVSTASFSPDGSELALGNGDGSVTLCTLRPCRLRAVLGTHPSRVWSLAYAPDGTTLAAAGGEWERGARKGFVSLWDVASGRELAAPAEAYDLELVVVFSPDGKTLAWGGRDRTVTLWDVAEGRVRALCVGHQGTVRTLAFHPGGRRLVSAGFDGTIRFWDTRTGAQDGEPIRLAGKSSNCIAVSPDGTSLALNTGPRSDDPGWGRPSPGSLQVWDWGTRKERLALEGHRYHILGVAFSPDGKTLASAGGHFSDGAEVMLWDVASGGVRQGLSGHKWWVECVAFSPDSHSLVSAGGYEKGPGEVRVWDLSSREGPGGE